MKQQPKPRPDRDVGDRGVRPLSRRATRLFVIGVFLAAIAFVAFMMYTLIRTTQDPELQRGIEEYRRDSGQAQDTTAVPYQPE
jgi:membrane-bound ClpP family serine protease